MTVARLSERDEQRAGKKNPLFGEFSGLQGPGPGREGQNG